MKRNNIAKRFGIASLCLATAFSAFGGLALLTDNVALAEGEVAVKDFVFTAVDDVKVDSFTTQTVANASVAKGYGGDRTYTGLRVSSDEAYSGTFKTVFKGDTRLNFKFPERFTDTNNDAYPDEFYGDFKFTITSLDGSESFDVVWHNNSTKSPRWINGVYVSYTDAEGTKYTRSASAKGGTNPWYNGTSDATNGHGAFYPFFLNYGGCHGAAAGSKTDYDVGQSGYLNLVWDDNGVLSVKVLGANQYTKNDITVAAFDDTVEDGFVSKSTWGLPSLQEAFADGYTISFSSNITKTRDPYIGTDGKWAVADNPISEDHDKGTDVLFTSITSNGTTYNLSGESVTVDTAMETFNNTFDALTVQETEAGKVFLGWKDTTTNALYPAYSIMRKGNIYEAVVIDYDVVTGASVRIAVGGQSGIRFQTMFNADDYEEVKDYITSFGTLITYTDTLTSVGKDFTIANYQGEASFAQVTNIRGLFDYTKDGTAYKAYTVAVVDLTPEEYTVKFSARGYFVVKYQGGLTKTFYTDYNDTDNSRSIAEVANRLKADTTAYDALSPDQKAIIEAYAAAQN